MAKRGRPPKIRVKEEVSVQLSLEQHLFERFIMLFTTGLYDIKSSCLRLGVSIETIKEIVNSTKENKLRFQEAIELNKENSKDKLVQKALKKLDDAIEGKEIITEKEYRYVNGKKYLIKEVEKGRGTDYRAVKDVLENFTDSFGNSLNPEKISQILIEFNRYVLQETNDLILVDKLLELERTFVDSLYLTK